MNETVPLPLEADEPICPRCLKPMSLSVCDEVVPIVRPEAVATAPAVGRQRNLVGGLDDKKSLCPPNQY